MASYILIEATTPEKKKYEKKYKCAYCEQRFTRQQLPSHIQKKHEDMIPEGHTALRVAFNIINKKTEGHCIICEQVTAWNEQKGRYERLCGRESCKKAYAAMAHKRVKDVYGTDCVLRDPRYKEEMLKKMLASRKISGTYKFSDGGALAYTGTYERKLLEFMDKIMHIESADILAPGPSIQYHFNGQDHLYLSDFLYVPYNLIIEVKDGGDNPNNRPMEEYRQKQLAKERAVRSDGTYNYLRLTNNEFSQLMEVMAVLKYTLAEDPEQKIVKVNESMQGMLGATIVPSIRTGKNSDNVYMVQHLQNNVFAYGITKDPTQNEIIGVDAEKGYVVSKMSKKDIPGSYITFKMRNRKKADELYNEAVKMLSMGAKVDDTDYFYRKYTGMNILSDDQILFDEAFLQVQNFDDELKQDAALLESYLKDDDKKSIHILEQQIDKLEGLMNADY